MVALVANTLFLCHKPYYLDLDVEHSGGEWWHRWQILYSYLPQILLLGLRRGGQNILVAISGNILSFSRTTRGHTMTKK
jgi:hypothetical protein